MRIRDQQRDALAKSVAARALVESFAVGGKQASYDSDNSEVRVVGLRAERTLLTLDGKGRIVQTLSPMGQRTSFKFEGAFLSAAQSSDGQAVYYDRADDGRRLRKTRADGSSEEVQLDEAGELVRYTLADKTFLSFVRNANGVARIVGRNGTASHRTYDSSGNLASISDALGRCTRLACTEEGNITRVEYADGMIEEYTYDEDRTRQFINGKAHADYQTLPEGRLLTAVYADGQALSFARDDGGRVVLAVSNDATVQCAYDADGRVLSEGQDGRVVRYTYDADGQLSSLTLPDGQSTHYQYDLDGRLSAVTDWCGGVQRFSYGSGARPVARELPNGLSERYSSDTLGRAASVELSGPLGSVWFQKTERDSVDRVIRRQDARFGDYLYGYDQGGRLTSVSDARSRASIESYGYDACDNRIQSQRGVITADLRDQPTTDGFFRFRNDPLGNRCERSSPHGTTLYAYGRENLLLHVTRTDGSVVSFGYDAFGRRVSKRAPDLLVTYVWAGQNMVQEIIDTPKGRTTREYLFMPGTHRPLALQASGSAAFYHCDQLDAPQLVTDATGRVVWSAQYEAYGNASPIVAELAQPLRLPGQYYDDETGLHYNRARYYDPILGRYLSRDPLAPVAGTNPYLYADGNPINECDPLGLWGESLPGWAKTTISIAGAVVAGALVGAAVIAAAPFLGVAAGVAGVAALVAGGLAAGAAGGALDAAMTEGGCISCGALHGAGLGLFGAGLFLLAPEGLGLLGLAAVGAAVSGATYLLDVATSDAKFNLGDFGLAVGLGAVLAPLSEFIGGALAKATGKGRGGGKTVYRGDDNPHSPAGRSKGTRKSHINSNGEIEPANPNGSTTPMQHVEGAPKAVKSDSPYTSFKENPDTGKAFGGDETQVDVQRLKRDIASGKVKDVEVIDNDQLMRMHQDNVDAAQSAYDADPSPANEAALQKAQKIQGYSARDSEALIKGTIPSEYVTKPGAKPGDAPQPVPVPPPDHEDDQ